MDAIAVLRRISVLLERSRAPEYRVAAFRRAAQTAGQLGPGDLEALAAEGRLRSLKGIGTVTEGVILAVLAGEVPDYLAKLESAEPQPFVAAGDALRSALGGDRHTHSLWSDAHAPRPAGLAVHRL